MCCNSIKISVNITWLYSYTLGFGDIVDYKEFIKLNYITKIKGKLLQLTKIWQCMWNDVNLLKLNFPIFIKFSPNTAS